MSLQNSHQISDVKVMLVKGIDGNGIASIEKTSSQGLVDVYTIIYTNGERSTFTVTNGAGGGMSALIMISSDAGSDVSVVAPSGRALVVEQVSGSSTLWQCETTEYGTHLIDSVLGGDDAQVSLNVDVCKVYTVDDSHMHADIIATYPEGATCSCGKSGETPVYATENPYTFTVHSTGTYDITIVADGQTYTDSVTVTESGQEFVVPAGSTVTPTDDVQMLLACAGVIDENITSLSDLFADSTSLSAVISNHNAIDYLVRSKTFANNPLIPIMTDNTHPSGEAFAYGSRSGYLPYYAFDGADTRWAGDVANSYIGYHFPSKTKFSHMYLYYLVRALASITFEIQGSNDGTNYTTIDTVTITSSDSTPTNHAYTKTFDECEYEYVRLFFATPPFVSTSSYFQVENLQFYVIPEGFGDNQSAMQYIGLDNYASNTLLADLDWRNAILNSSYRESVLNKYAPVMTSDSTPSGLCFGNRGFSDYYYAFDGNDNTKLGVINPSSTHTTDNQVGYDFGESVKIYGMVYRGNIDTPYLVPEQFVAQYSSDNSNYTNIITEYPKADGNEHVVVYPNAVNGRYHRLSCTDRKNTQNNVYYCQFATIQFYGRVDV